MEGTTGSSCCDNFCNSSSLCLLLINDIEHKFCGLVLEKSNGTKFFRTQLKPDFNLLELVKDMPIFCGSYVKSRRKFLLATLLLAMFIRQTHSACTVECDGLQHMCFNNKVYGVGKLTYITS